MEQSVQEGNRKIAEFMGLESMLDERFYPETTLMFFREGWVKTADLKYHTSWDWLMPVVEKIDALVFTWRSESRKDKRYWMWIWEDEEENPVVASCEFTLIASVYTAVLQFITWYNTHKTSKDGK